MACTHPPCASHYVVLIYMSLCSIRQVSSSAMLDMRVALWATTSKAIGTLHHLIRCRTSSQPECLRRIPFDSCSGLCAYPRAALCCVPAGMAGRHDCAHSRYFFPQIIPPLHKHIVFIRNQPMSTPIQKSLTQSPGKFHRVYKHPASGYQGSAERFISTMQSCQDGLCDISTLDGKTYMS